MDAILRFLFPASAAVLLATGLTACSDGSDEPLSPTPPTSESSQRNGTFFSLTLRPLAPLVGRGTPVGGPHGDGRYPALERENFVQNATLLFYRSKDGINAPSNTPIEYALYADCSPVMEDGKVKAYTTGVLHSDTPFIQGTYHYVVLVNTGDRTNLKGSTLGKVRDLMIDRQWVQSDPSNPETAELFVMSNTTDPSMTFTGDGGPKNVVYGEVTVERLAARIDFSPGVSPKDNTDNVNMGGKFVQAGTVINVQDENVTLPACYRYEVVSNTGGATQRTKDIFYLTHVTPINLWTGGSYLVKRVCDFDWTDYSHLEYLGQERASTAGEATNYVVSPHIFEKGDKTTFNSMKANYASSFTTPELLSARPVQEELPYEDHDVNSPLRYYTLTYTQENTITPEAWLPGYTTGLVFSGYYGLYDEATQSHKFTQKTYTRYIRHADPNASNSDALKMKYGIVRNNLYRVYVHSVNSLGLVLVEIKNWITIQVPEIQM